jgi:hypothetical protein
MLETKIWGIGDILLYTTVLRSLEANEVPVLAFQATRHTRLARFEETVNHATHTTRRPPRNDALEFNSGERERRTMDGGGGCVTCAIKFNRRTYGAIVKFHPLRLKIWSDLDDVNLIILESRCDTRHELIGHVRLPKFRQTSAPKPPASVPIGQKSMSSSCAKF